MSDGMIDRAMQFNYQMLRPKDVEDKKDKQPQKAETGAEGTESAQDTEAQKPTKQLLTQDTTTKPVLDGAKQETAKAGGAAGNTEAWSGEGRLCPYHSGGGSDSGSCHRPAGTVGAVGAETGLRTKRGKDILHSDGV